MKLPVIHMRADLMTDAEKRSCEVDHMGRVWLTDLGERKARVVLLAAPHEVIPKNTEFHDSIGHDSTKEAIHGERSDLLGSGPELLGGDIQSEKSARADFHAEGFRGLIVFCHEAQRVTIRNSGEDKKEGAK